MQDLTRDNITQAVLKTIEKTENPRLKQLLTAVIQHLHDLVRETGLTHEEWLAGIDFLFRAGQISTPIRNEFILTSDVLGVSSLVDIINDPAAVGTTETSVLGPFFVEGSPDIPFGGAMKGVEEGEAGVLLGRVTDAGGTPIPGALLDVWQTAHNGFYQVVDPNQPEGNMRCRIHTNPDGAYRFNSIKPVSYKVPEDGPCGAMFEATGRHAWRPAHIHFRVSAAGWRPLTTSLFVREDPYIGEDAVFGVRDSLTVSFVANGSAEEGEQFHLKPPFWKVEYDFKLQPAK